MMPGGTADDHAGCMRHALTVLKIEASAPDKPEVGAPCNGCGVCCLAEPCPLGIVLSGRKTAACAALVWREEEHRYLCGALSTPKRFAGALSPLLVRLARRWISAGSGMA